MTSARDRRLATPLRDYDDVARFVLALVREQPLPYAARAGVAERSMRHLLSALSHPERSLRCVHIAGSKGKGSVALMLEALLLASGARVGTFTSPHLRRWNERFRIDGEAVPDTTLVAAMERLRRIVVSSHTSDGPGAPSFFEALTAASLAMFSDAACDWVILECGLGGRYDATNAIVPAIGCITSIEYEHTDKLGDSLSEIAWHKAGIAKRDVPLVVARLPDEARDVVEREARSAGAPLVAQDTDFAVHATPAAAGGYHVTLDANHERFTFRVPHPAEHMALNAALAVMLCVRLGVTPRCETLASLSLPARAQIVCDAPRVIVDGAHTEASLTALEACLRDVPSSRRRFLLAASGNKRLDAMAELVHGAERVVVTAPDALRSTPAEALADALRGAGVSAPLFVVASPEQALRQALDGLADDGLLCITGSVYLAGWALDQPMLTPNSEPASDSH